ncbi:MAG: GNAT family N-acetyltransferase [Roseburia sp.]
MQNEIYTLRRMTMEDYDRVHALWMSIKGFGIRSIDDSREGVERFIRRNPTTSIVACVGENIVGAILCGHDGRRACFYHVCVDESYRKHGIGKAMAEKAMEELRAENINKVNLIAFKNNEVGNRFWQSMGWTFREDLNYYDCTLNPENLTNFVTDPAKAHHNGK